MSNLQVVAEHLSVRARDFVSSQADADAYGRSAFNRFYYSSFLSVRDLLILIDAAWAKTPHTNIPGVLELNLVKKIKDTAMRQERSGLLSPVRRSAMVSQSMTAITEISSVLKSAYTVRLAADYEPSLKIVFGVEGFELDSCSIGDARSWKGRIERNKGTIINISRELGLVA